MPWPVVIGERIRQLERRGACGTSNPPIADNAWSMHCPACPEIRTRLHLDKTNGKLYWSDREGMRVGSNKQMFLYAQGYLTDVAYAEIASGEK